MNDWQKNNPQETRGWEIVKQLNEMTGANGSNGFNGLNSLNGSFSAHAMKAAKPSTTSLDCRKLLAEYLKLDNQRPSRLHSAILSCAVKMATTLPEFHLVPFMEIWGLENLRTEDSEARVGNDGKRFPSLVERMTKAYAYSLMFHPEEHLEPAFEEILKPTLTHKGYRLEEKAESLEVCSYVLATRVILSDVRNRKMTFVSLLTPWGEELITEVHTMTQFSGFGKLTQQKLMYDDISNQMFRVILRTSEKGNLRVEAAILSDENIEDKFATSVGYVEHIDGNRRFIHIYDNESRHMVQRYGLTTDIKEGDYVRFVPVIPKGSDFKTAIITSVMENRGAEAFGYRYALITFVSKDQEYCAWELLPEADGQIKPIVETGAKEAQEPGVKGYISKAIVEKVKNGSNGSNGSSGSKIVLPQKGDHIQIITFLKRGKDGKKKPFVVWYK